MSFFKKLLKPGASIKKHLSRAKAVISNPTDIKGHLKAGLSPTGASNKPARKSNDVDQEMIRNDSSLNKPLAVEGGKLTNRGRVPTRDDVDQEMIRNDSRKKQRRHVYADD